MARQLIVIISFAVAVVLFSLAGLIYLSFDISSNVKKIEGLRNDLAFNNRITRSLSQLRADLNSIQPYLSTLDKILSSRDQLIKFGSDANVLAARNTISIISKFSSELKNSEGLASIGLNMTAEGSYDNFINYLKAFENSRYSVKFNVIDFYNNAGMVKSQMTGQVFYYEK
ncbi:MAG: hypothetical protein AAB405_00490 [Patescibacteria group bacterium]